MEELKTTLISLNSNGPLVQNRNLQKKSTVAGGEWSECLHDRFDTSRFDEDRDWMETTQLQAFNSVGTDVEQTVFTLEKTQVTN